MTLRRSTLLAAPLLAVLAGCAHPPSQRYFQPTAAQIGPEPNSYGEAVIPLHGLIVVQGDDFAYGLAQGRSRHRINGADEGQAAVTLSETLRRAVRGVRVENRGFPGDTAAMSAERWADAPPADLTILSLSYGDAAAHTDVAEFRSVVRAMVRAAHAHGAVFAILPPPSADPLANQSDGEYREVLREVAKSEGAVVFDAFDAMNRLRLKRSKVTAQAALIYQGAAADMAPYIKVVDAPAPQAGQSGSADSRTVRDSAASPS